MSNTTNWASPDLQSLVDLFFPNPAELGVFREVPSPALPDAYRRLLAHPHHMTVANEEFHHSPVAVEVLAEQQTVSHYSRQILLRRATDGQVVQYGIVRINRQQIPAPVMAEIEARTLPLGRVLIDHNMMRTVKLLSLWHVIPGPYLIEQFSQGPLAECFGRTAILYLNALPVVELLEIVKV
ncbi:MAG: hypothetical protein JNL67_04840 [Planctomycetaceae bacterium]|nr:hypothetical protein [Planctomycetaceae bacterium]